MIKYFYKGKKTTRRFLEAKFGYSFVRNRIKEARDKWGYDPYVKCQWPDGMCFVNGLIC